MILSNIKITILDIKVSILVDYSKLARFETRESNFSCASNAKNCLYLSSIEIGQSLSLVQIIGVFKGTTHLTSALTILRRTAVIERDEKMQHDRVEHSVMQDLCQAVP
uniref:Uncharacterized protein n=1 Tax=Romanomermis culicivorax TaxID=13658 RepID=A0A915J7I1_ROMCU